MKSNDELKEIDIENCTYYYFDDIIKTENFDFNNTLIDEKSYQYLLVSNISYKTFIGAKPLRIRFDKVDGFIRVYDPTRYLVLLRPGKYDAIYNRNMYLISQKSGITCIVSHNYAKIKIYLYDTLPLENFDNVIILVKSVFNKDKSYYYNKK